MKETVKGGKPVAGILSAYLEVVKPRETGLLTLIGAAAAFVAGDGRPAVLPFLLAILTVALGSAGCNGVTNYLDRQVDSRMMRTRGRALPSGRIHPPERALFLSVALLALAFPLSWILHSLAFLFLAVGVLASVLWRKTSLCPLLGAIAGSAPVLIGWFVVRPQFDVTIVLLVAMIWVWIPIHVWSVMIANREDYLAAGVRVFPIVWETKKAVRLLLALSFVLYLLSLALALLGNFSLAAGIVLNLLGLSLLYTNLRLTLSASPKDAWRVYKLSAYPYLGLAFLVLSLDLWLR